MSGRNCKQLRRRAKSSFFPARAGVFVGFVGLAPLSGLAASATWNTSPTNGNWEATGTENNWSTGAATFPGATGSLTNADVATFLTSGTTSIAINSTAGNTLSLGIKGITIGVSGSTPDTFTIGSTSGNSLLLASGGTIQVVSGATGTTTQTINAPLVLEPASGTTAGTYSFVNSGAVGTALVIAGSVSAGTTTGVGSAGRVTLSLGGTNTNVNNVVSGVISDGGATGGLVINRNGNSAGTVWAITGTNNSFTGGLILTQGILRVATISNTGSNSSIGAGGAITVNTTSGGNNNLVITGAGGSTDRNITITRSGASSNGLLIDSSGSGAVTFSGGVTASSTTPVSATVFNLLSLSGTFTGGDNTISGAITDNNNTAGNERLTAVTKTNSAATWVLSGTGSNYTGPTTISGGTLAGIGANAFGNTSGISVAGGGVLSLRGDSNTVFTKTDNVTRYAVTTTASGSTINADQATVAGTAAKTMTIGSVGTTSVAASYVLNFTGANNTSLSVGAVTGAASTAAGAVTLSNALVSSGSVTIASYQSANTTGGETVTFNGVGNTTVTGAITPSSTTLSLSKSGNGTLSLNGSSSYSGATTVSAGTLLVNGNNSGATGTVTVNGTGTLGGIGTIGGAVAVNSGGTLAPGNLAIGTLTSASLAMASGSTLSLELSHTLADTLVVTSAGSVNVTGATLSGSVIGSLVIGDLFRIVDNQSASAVTGTFSGLAQGGTFTSGTNSFAISYIGGTGNDITLTALTPEPTSLSLIGLGGFALLRRRRAKTTNSK